MTGEEVDYLLPSLPEEPPEDLIGWTEEHGSEELGGDYLIFHNERMRLPPSLEMLMDNHSVGKSVWVTQCHCTACGEDFTTEKGGRRSFFMVDGDDGYSYPILPDGEITEDLLKYPISYQKTEYTANDGIFCPCCENQVRIVHREDVRGGRTKQLQVAQLTNVGRYTAVILWLVRRTVYEWGVEDNAQPRFAYVLGQKGELKAFTHRHTGVWGKDYPAANWRPLSDSYDRWDARYHDWGSINDTKVGTAVWSHVPTEREMVGTTGEKTGILPYWEKAGDRPIAYLKLWQKRKNVENLVNAGFAKIVSDAILSGLRYGADTVTELEKAANLKERKPYKMLGLTRKELEQLQESEVQYTALKHWRAYRQAGGKEDIEVLLNAFGNWGGSALESAIEIMRKYGDCDLSKLGRYMEKQGLPGRNMGLLLDARAAAQKLYERQTLTEEERWPRNLQQTHDRLTEQIALRNQREKAEGWQKCFDAVAEKYKDIQWSDGRLAVILPRSNDDLVREGKVLRHCVGGYGESHSGGNRIILFVRHYRRPERSYYTLNMDFGKDVPTEIQLHGYGNERHGDHKQYTHHIPKEVRAFVDRWKEEVVAPWWRQQNKTAKEKTA